MPQAKPDATKIEGAQAWPRGPTGKGLGGWLVGPLAEFERDRIGFFLSTMRDHGDFVAMRLGHKRVFLVSRPEWVKTILQDQYRSFDKSSPAYKQIKLVLRDGLFTAEGDHWRRHRKLSQPAFHRDRIRGFAQVMGREAVALGQRWARRAGETVDLLDEMMRVTLSVVGETLLGADLSSHTAAIGQALPEVLELLERRVLQPIPLPLRIPTTQNRRLRRAIESLERVVAEILEARRHRGGPREDLLDMLMLARDEVTGEGMDDFELRDEILTFMLAGHETTAIVLTWSFYLLDRNPEMAAALVAELDAVLGGRTPTFEDIPRLVYTRAVVREAIRLYPPVWMFSRRALEEVTIGPYVVPRGSIVLICPYALHRNPRVWDRPESFRPERFLPGQEEQVDRFAFLGFGGGPRVCIGAQFAEVEAMILLAELFQRVRLSLAPGAEIALSSSMSLRPKFGMPMHIGVR